MIPEPSRATHAHRHGRHIVGLSVAVLVVMSLLGYMIWSGYQQAIQNAETTTRNYAAIIEARLGATLRRVDADLQELTHSIPAAALNRSAVSRYGDELHFMLAVHAVNFPEVAGYRVTDANGDRLYTSDSAGRPRSNLGDRKYFSLLRDNPGVDLVFSEAVVSRIGGRPSVIVARPLRDGQGSFRGTVFAVIELIYFQKLFQSLDIGGGGVIAIFRSDDYSQVLRWPPADDKINVPLAPDSPTRMALARGIGTGTVQTASTVDRAVRIYSHQALERYPFFVSVGVSREEATASWRARSLTAGVSALLIMGLVFSLVIRLWRTEDELVGFNTELDSRVRERTAELEAANRELEAFSYSTSHDLRTPLRAINGFAEILIHDERGRLSGEGARLLDRIAKAASKLGNMSDQVREYMRLGRTPMRRVQTDLAELCRAVVEEIQPKYPAVQFALGRLPSVTGDTAMLKLVLQNLVGNACKFSAAAANPKVEVGVEEAGQAVYVRDNGRGFDMRYADQLFRMFHRLHDEEEFAGLGAGLAITRRLIERHGGRIWAESEPGKGATFYFALG